MPRITIKNEEPELTVVVGSIDGRGIVPLIALRPGESLPLTVRTGEPIGFSGVTVDPPSAEPTPPPPPSDPLQPETPKTPEPE